MKSNTFKKYFFTGMLSIAMLTAAACGQNPAPDSATAEQNAADPEATDTTDTSQPNESNTAIEPEEPAIPSDVTVTMDEFYGDTRCAMHLLGLQEYEKLESEDFTDTPEEGFQYLVLFLQIENRTETEDYFNTELLEASLDGEEITNSFLVNEPENYSTIFTNIPAGNTVNGFIVWQVPKDWSTLALTYRGWEGSGGITVHALLTPDDLKTPPNIDETI